MSHTVVPALAGWLETSPDKAQEHTHTHGSYANVYSPGANKLLSTHAVRAQCGCLAVAKPFRLAISARRRPTAAPAAPEMQSPRVYKKKRRVIEPYALRQTTWIYQ